MAQREGSGISVLTVTVVERLQPSWRAFLRSPERSESDRLLRSLIVEPIQVVSKSGEPGGFNVVHYGALLVAIFIVGGVHRPIGDGATVSTKPEAARPDGI